jgi:hypothetical protein
MRAVLSVQTCGYLVVILLWGFALKGKEDILKDTKTNVGTKKY